MNKYKERHTLLIRSANGSVADDLYVTKVGVMMTKKSGVTQEARELFDEMNMCSTISSTDKHAEFNGRLTYLSFPDKPALSNEYHDKMIHQLGHRSVYNDEMVTFLIAGCSMEIMTEFLAHNEATIARLTSSKTNAQNNTLYRLRVDGVSDKFVALQRRIIKEFQDTRTDNREMIDKSNSIEKEVFNIMSLGCKAVSFTITMSIKDWHKTFIGRFSDSGVESEMIEILDDVINILRVDYPNFFNTKDEYYSMGNGVKYEST